ncbi:DUF2345 domain-containing protein, partial [Rhodovulum sulfidophilum]|uniref:type VI secretion system Vgr family protein n=1 Tax=Rhodovulum sulfidophilum TaxID=35806 RepID=UPI00192710DF
QSWAGAGWGGMVIPRIGMEVVVEFLDGDPDKPLVTGCVYNGRNPVPYDLPANKTVSTFKSDTHQGAGFNELRFEDENGREEVYLRAEKDLSLRVRDNAVSNIGGLSVENIDKDKWEMIGNAHTLRVGKDYNIDVGFERDFGGSFGYHNLGDDSLQSSVFGYDSKGFDLGETGDYRLNVKGTITQTTQSTFTLRAKDSTHIESDQTLRLEAGRDFDVNAGRNLDLTATRSLVGTAADFIKIEVAGVSLTISKDGCARLRGTNIEIHADDKVDIRAGNEIRLSAARIDLN